MVSVDLFGRACETGPLTALASEFDLPIIQDAAQSIGALDGDGIAVGQRSQIACFSFYPTKNLGALGDAGALVTSDPSLHERLRRLRSHGASKEGQYEELGINSRLDALQAVALSTKLPHLPRWTSARRQHALRYDRLFAERGAATSSPGSDPALESHRLPLATPVPSTSPALHTYHRYVIRVPADRRSALRAGLADAGIASEIYYPIGTPPAAGDSALPPAEHRPPSLPAIESACNETLALPLYPEMGVERVERVVDAVTKLLT